MTTPVLWKAETQVNTHDGAVGVGGNNVQADGHLVGLADGGYMVVWTDGSRAFNASGNAVVGQRYDSLGERVGGEFEVGVSAFATGVQSSPAITILPSGAVGVAFVDIYDDPDPLLVLSTITVRRFDSSHNPAGFDEIHASYTPAFDPSITSFGAGGGYVVSYTVGSGADTDIVANIVSPAGAISAQFDIHNEADNSNVAALATLSNGNFVAVFEDEFNGSAADIDIRYRILTPTGSGVTASITVHGAGGGAAETAPDVAALPGGGFIVAWTDAAGDADGNGIRATILDNAGNPVRADFAVNTSTAGSQFAPNVVTLAEGGFLVSWQDGGAGALRGQRFDALGNTMGSEFTVRNEATAAAPDAARLQDGRIAYAADDFLTGDSDVVTSIWNPRGNIAALGDVLWRHNGGTAATGRHDLGIVPNTWHIPATGDFDADGDSDILWRHNDGLVVTWEMQNGQYLTNHNIAFASTGWEIVSTGDFDADGDADVLWRHQEGAVVTWEMENGAYVVNHNIAFASTGWRIDGLGDFDGDGDSDVIWRHQEGAVVTWEMENGGYVVNHNIAFASTGWRIQGTGDFDGDGDADILWRHDGGTVVTWEMQGGNYVVNHNLPVVSNSWQIRGAEDFDSDGDSDILWRHDDGQVVTWEMQGGNYVVNHNIGEVTNDWQIRGTGEFDLV